MPMQKMLTWLVVGLTLAVGVLGVFTFKLYMDGGSSGVRLAPATPPPRTALAAESPDAARIEALERRLAALQLEYDAQKRRLTILANAAEAAAGLPREPGAAPLGNGADGPPDPPAFAGGLSPRRGPDGSFEITREEEDYYLALKERVEIRTRIDTQTKSVMNRIERLAGRGEIGALPPPTRDRVEGIVRGFVAAGDDLVVRYLRAPSAEIAALSPEQRRDAMMRDRDELVQRAKIALEPVVGAADAAKVAEESLQNPWGLRSRETGERRNRIFGNRDDR